jgi:hypothetical protein
VKTTNQRDVPLGEPKLLKNASVKGAAASTKVARRNVATRVAVTSSNGIPISIRRL